MIKDFYIHAELKGAWLMIERYIRYTPVHGYIFKELKERIIAIKICNWIQWTVVHIYTSK